MKQNLINMYNVYCIIVAFDKPQTTITEESESGVPNGRARENELTHLGYLSYLYLSWTLNACIFSISAMCLCEQFFHCHAENSGRGKKRGMVLPFEPYSLTFDQIVYSVDMPQVSHFKVIDNISVSNSDFSLIYR